VPAGPQHPGSPGGTPRPGRRRGRPRRCPGRGDHPAEGSEDQGQDLRGRPDGTPRSLASREPQWTRQPTGCACLLASGVSLCAVFGAVGGKCASLTPCGACAAGCEGCADFHGWPGRRWPGLPPSPGRTRGAATRVYQGACLAAQRQHYSGTRQRTARERGHAALPCPCPAPALPLHCPLPACRAIAATNPEGYFYREKRHS
jgi:hypothetical protein